MKENPEFHFDEIKNIRNDKQFSLNMKKKVFLFYYEDGKKFIAVEFPQFYSCCGWKNTKF